MYHKQIKKKNVWGILDSRMYGLPLGMFFIIIIIICEVILVSKIYLAFPHISHIFGTEFC